MEKAVEQKASELRSHIGYRLRVVSNAVSHAFAGKLAASDVTVAEWVILREMYGGEDKTSPSTVAELTGLTRGAVSKLIERLLRKGFVTRTAYAEDRRCQELKLTESAMDLVPKLARIADDNEASFFSVLSLSERDVLMNTLVKLSEFHRLNTNPIE